MIKWSHAAKQRNRNEELKSVDVATADFMPNLINLKPDVEVKNTKILDSIYNEYFAKLVMGQGDIDATIKELSSKWRS